ncbi:hypothetical protein HNQ60_003716 [Povalibacter uvarum]|uniref:Uncharacterized protein n=1 Tax=Povalibacter uvarum TaxID=732238 RepID=A0A841HR80_9GAMM|nr:hypothetical protein [Povalibacter uvarum]MBB6094829.1 hypothetical protein [Povalibacter uvarum]
MILRRMQELLARLYDAPVEQDVEDYLIPDRERLAELSGEECHADEQVVLVEKRGEVRVGVYIDRSVLARLEQRDPLDALSDENLRDYCTAIEGVSHFNYLMWSLARSRNVSLLELELQADVDKYAGAVKLLTAQECGHFPVLLHRRLFDRVGYLPHLNEESRCRYEAANRHAARFCRSLEERFLRPRRSRPEAWVSALRQFFRSGQQEKLRLAAM